MEFKAFPKIQSLSKTEMYITQKIHGTNAQVFILPTDSDGEFPAGSMIHIDEIVKIDDKKFAVRAGSRTRWIYPEDDNFGFATFVRANKEMFARSLGPGQHFGEWAGPGINSGEGLSQKTLVLFDFWKYPPEHVMPPQTTVVPVLYKGLFDLKQIDTSFEELRTKGSSLVPGFMCPEGIVVSVLGTRLKRVFDPEDTQWRKPSETKAKTELMSVSHLLQPIRMEKLLSKDERYIRDFPKSLSELCSAYISDLIEEGQITGNKDEIKATQKALGSQLFSFAKQAIAEYKKI